jgi:predicted GIY-YIG superfamily endonuclease
MSYGKVVKLHLRDATVAGFRVAEIVNQTIQSVAFARTDENIGKLGKYPEGDRPGVYMLFGEDENEKATVYIGESENVQKRLLQHIREGKKEFTEIVFFTSKDENLTKAHVRYLESALIELALKNRKYSIINVQQSEQIANDKEVAAHNMLNSQSRQKYINRALLPLSEIDAMAEYLGSVALLLGVLGHKLLDIHKSAQVKTNTKLVESISNTIHNIQSPNESPSFLYLKIKTADAKAVQIDTGGLRVLAGSKIGMATPTIPRKAKETREALLENNELTQQADYMLLNIDFDFSSPSSAAAFIAGGSINGRDAWKTADGKSLKDLEEAIATEVSE